MKVVVMILRVGDVKVIVVVRSRGCRLWTVHCRLS